MTALQKELLALTDIMAEQECYKKYQETLKKIKQNQKLYDKLNEYRKSNVELHYHKQTLKAEAALARQYHDFLEEDDIREFLYWEQKTLKMLRMIYKTIGETLDLDYGFLS